MHNIQKTNESRRHSSNSKTCGSFILLIIINRTRGRDYKQTTVIKYQQNYVTFVCEGQIPSEQDKQDKDQEQSHRTMHFDAGKHHVVECYYGSHPGV